MHHARLIERFVIHEDKGGFLRRSSAGNGFCDVLLTANLAAACIGHDGQILYTAAQAMFPFPGGILIRFAMAFSLKAKSPGRGLYPFVLPVPGATALPRIAPFIALISCAALALLDAVLYRRLCAADRTSIMALLWPRPGDHDRCQCVLERRAEATPF